MNKPTSELRAGDGQEWETALRKVRRASSREPISCLKCDEGISDVTVQLQQTCHFMYHNRQNFLGCGLSSLLLLRQCDRRSVLRLFVLNIATPAQAKGVHAEYEGSMGNSFRAMMMQGTSVPRRDSHGNIETSSDTGKVRSRFCSHDVVSQDCD